nr:hypothetical protein [Clostridia bacterium]
MVKALLKKQLLESLAFFIQGKNGKRRSTAMIVGFAALMIYAFGAVGFMFWSIADMLCAPLVQGGMAWVYFAFMGTLATGVGIVGGIFTAKAKLYEAKDNDLLLSMPIPSWAVLLSRMAGLYLFVFLFEGLVFVPAIARYFTVAGFATLPLLCSLMVLFVMPLGALAICCILGWLIALITSKIPVKNLIDLVFSVAFLVTYFALYSKINEYMGYVISHGETVGGVMKTTLCPFSQLGLACTGKGVALSLFLLIFAGLFALVYLVLSTTYLRLATANKGSFKVKYTGKGYKGKSVFSTLLQREAWRYLKNAMVALNSFLGSVFFILLPIALLFDLETFRQFALALEKYFPLLLAAILCAVGSTNLITSASVSLEGDSLDVIRVLPIKTEKILLAKIAFHLLTTAIPATVSVVMLAILFKLSVGVAATVLVSVLLFIALCAFGGLTANLLLPSLKWTNEVAVVKQSVSTLVSMFGGWGAVALFVGGYFLFGKYLPAWGYLLVCSAVLALCVAGLWLWIKKKGVKRFEGL